MKAHRVGTGRIAAIGFDQAAANQCTQVLACRRPCVVRQQLHDGALPELAADHRGARDQRPFAGTEAQASGRAA